MAIVAAPAFGVEKSGNGKIGKFLVSATYVTQYSCTDGCPAKHTWCYAGAGKMQFQTARVNNAWENETPEAIARLEAAAIDQLSGKRPLRLHVVGDCDTDEAARIVSAAAERYMARGGQRVWTYTHSWRHVARESWGTVSVLASCETSADIVAARARGYATELSYDTDSGQPLKGQFRVDGLDVIACPNQTSDTITCASCRLCFDDAGLFARGKTIGLKTHGAKGKQAAGDVLRIHD